MWILSKKIVHGVGPLNDKFSGPVLTGGMVIGQGDTCVIHSLMLTLVSSMTCKQANWILRNMDFAKLRNLDFAK